jgi:hypothetical protein
MSDFSTFDVIAVRDGHGGEGSLACFFFIDVYVNVN